MSLIILHFITLSMILKNKQTDKKHLTNKKINHIIRLIPLLFTFKSLCYEKISFDACICLLARGFL